MKKIFLILVVLLAAAPAMAVVTITATQVGTTDEVDLIVTWSGEGSPPRAFAIDVNVGGGQTITGVSGYHTGDSNASGKGYGIFPASFARYINPDFNNWDDVNYTPVADVNDLPGDTEGGIGTSGVTLELGSLYVGAPNAPTSPVTLARIKVSGDCTMCFARNVGRGKVVLEDGNEPSSFSAPCFAVTVVCTVPDVVDWTSILAQGAIVAADFNVGVITTNCSDSIADGNVISTDPAAFETPGCGTDVNIVVSTGQPTVPNVLDMNETEAIAAINAVAYISAGTPTYECNDVEAAGEVLSQSHTGTAPCGTEVIIAVSTGSCAPSECTISGTVDDPCASGLAGITITGFPGDPVVTDADGNYVATVEYGWSGTATPVYVPSPNTVTFDPTYIEYVSVTCSSPGPNNQNYIATQCINPASTEYGDWVSWNRPQCWCYQKQCRGDTDGKDEFFKPVLNADLNLFQVAFNKSTAELQLVVVGGVPGICADVDHGKEFFKHVLNNDLNIFQTYFNQADGSVPVCDQAPVITGPYNFWTN